MTCTCTLYIMLRIQISKFNSTSYYQVVVEGIQRGEGLQRAGLRRPAGVAGEGDRLLELQQTGTCISYHCNISTPT
jgi:hypothetical protein